MARKPPAQPLYRVHPGVLMIAGWERGLKDTTGRTIAQWCVHLDAHCAGADRAARIAHLRSAHGIGAHCASWIAGRSVGEAHPWYSTEADYLAGCPAVVDAQFAGAKAHLRPIGDALLDLCRACGPDVGISPCGTIIPAYRSHVFAQVSVPNRKVVRLSLALKGERFTKRLIDTGGTAKKDRLTHRVDIASPDEIDDTVRTSLARAYERDA